LHELRVPVDIVTGTSMGSIVGGLYAAGYTPEQLDKVVRDTDWASIFDTRAPRADLDWRRKEDDYKNLSDFELGIVDGGLTLPRGLAGTQRLEFFLRSLSGPAKRVRDLSQLPLPFAAIGTDLENGRRVVLQKDISLSTAMRASMSVPGAFPPVEVHGRLLVDGGVVDNLPVDAARALGADIIIAVNVGTPLLKREQLTDVVNVAAQLTLMMGLDTIERSIASLKPTDVLITPQLDGLGSSAFTDGDRIVAAGEAAARAIADRLAALGVEAPGFAQFEEQRTRLVRDDGPFRVDEVRVAGTRAVQREAIEAQVEPLRGRTLTAEEIAPVLDRIYSSGDFEAVSYSVVQEGAGTTLMVLPIEKSWGYNVLRLGGNAQTNFNDDNTFNLLLAHSWRWLNTWGAEWRNEVQIGESRRLATEWYQPLGAGSRWFVLPRLESLRTERDLFVRGVRITRFENTQDSAELWLGRELPQLGTARVGMGRGRLATKPLIGVPFSAISSDASAALVGWRSDTLDNVLFPRSGMFFDVEYGRYFDAIDEVNGEAATAEVILPVSFGRTTASISVRAGRAVQRNTFELGGLFNLSGTLNGAVSGSRGVLVRSQVYRSVPKLAGIRMPLVVGLSLETGDAVERGAALRWSQFKRAGSLYASVDTLFGPVFLALGKTFGGDAGVYLFWGRPQ
nr:patatin-like phospholipase family protein [Burkholderiaceae bacterium]